MHGAQAPRSVVLDHVLERLESASPRRAVLAGSEGEKPTYSPLHNCHLTTTSA